MSRANRFHQKSSSQIRRASVALAFAVALTPISMIQAQPADHAALNLSEEADIHFRLGLQAYQADRYKDALQYFLTSNRLVPNAAVHLNLALTYEALGQKEQALQHDYQIKVMTDDKELIALAEESANRIKKSIALLRITTSPEGATVYIDRKDLGSRGITPLDLALSEGDHILYLEHQYFRKPEPIAINIKKGETKNIRVPLDPYLTRVSFDGTPDGATVTCKGKNIEVGYLPCELLLQPSQVICTIKANQYKPINLPIQVNPDQPLDYYITMDPLYGSAMIDADIVGAQIEIDGDVYGYTPMLINRIHSGKHQLRLTHSGMIPYQQEIEITPNEVFKTSVVLKPVEMFMSSGQQMESIDDIAISVDVVTDREIRVFGYRTVFDALQGIRGVTGQSDGQYDALVIRGFSSSNETGQHSLVRMGNHRMNFGMLGVSMVDDALMPSLGDVKRIEVIRGASSSHYGPNAMSGVINVLPNDNTGSQLSHFEIGHNENKSLRLRASTSYQWSNKGGFWFSGEYIESQGEDWTLHLLQDANPVEVKGIDSKTVHSLSACIWQGNLSLQLNHNLRKQDLPFPLRGSLIGDGRHHSDEKRDMLSLDYHYIIREGVTVSFNSYVDDMTRDLDQPMQLQDGGLKQEKFDSAWAGMELKVDVALPGQIWKLTTGLEANKSLWSNYKKADELGNEWKANPDEMYIGAFMIGDLSINKQLRFTAGGRANLYEDMTSYYSPHLGIVYKPSDITAYKLMASFGYRPVDRIEEESIQAQSNSPLRPALKAEKAWSFNLEYAHKLPSSFKFIGALFFNQIENPLLLTNQDIASGKDLPQSQDDALQTIGGELEIQREWLKNWFFTANYSYQRTRIGGLIDGDPILNSPEHLLKLKIASPLRRIGITLANRFRFESSRKRSTTGETNNAYYWDIIATPNSLLDGHFDFIFGFNNILNWKNEQSAAAASGLKSMPETGRSIHVTLRGQL